MRAGGAEGIALWAPISRGLLRKRCWEMGIEQEELGDRTNWKHIGAYLMASIGHDILNHWVLSFQIRNSLRWGSNETWQKAPNILVKMGKLTTR